MMENDDLLDAILAKLPDSIRQFCSITPKGKLLIPGLSDHELSISKAICANEAVKQGFILDFRQSKWDETEIYDLTVTITMTKEELLARFAALDEKAKEIVLLAASTARAAIEAGDKRPTIEITRMAVRAAMLSKGMLQ